MPFDSGTLKKKKKSVAATEAPETWRRNEQMIVWPLGVLTFSFERRPWKRDLFVGRLFCFVFYYFI